MNPPDPIRIHAAKQYAEKLKVIPTSEWCTGEYSDYEGRHCSVGHLVFLDGNHLPPKFQEIENHFSSTLGRHAFAINDEARAIGKRVVHTPKRNILRALNRVIKGKTT